MKLSLATRISVGYAAVLITFGAIALFAVWAMKANQSELRMIRGGYLPLSRDVAAIEAVHENAQRETARLLAEDDVATRRGLIHLQRLYRPSLFVQRLTAASMATGDVRKWAVAAESPALDNLMERMSHLSARDIERTKALDALFLALETDAPDPNVVAQRKAEVARIEQGSEHDIRSLLAAIEGRIRARAAGAEARERLTGIAILVLSFIAGVVGLVATLLSVRALRPVRALTEAVGRLARGDYGAPLAVQGEDEIAKLARGFDSMRSSLQQREHELRLQQEALGRAQQLAAVGKVSAQIAHEVRNPLSSIGLNTELLQDLVARASFRTETDATEAREVLSSIGREIDRVSDVTERYLGMARPLRVQLRAEDVNSLVTSILDFSREEFSRAAIRVERHLVQTRAWALCDERQLRQVFVNLVRNSREAMGEGGTLRVETRVDAQFVDTVFSDTGPGVSPEDFERIFEPFYSTKPTGTGLGLAVSRQIVQAQGGSIRCERMATGGAAFCVRLPRAAAVGTVATG